MFIYMYICIFVRILVVFQVIQNADIIQEPPLVPVDYMNVYVFMRRRMCVCDFVLFYTI